MANNEAGKGDKPRPFDRKKWDAFWVRYEANKKQQQELARRRNSIGGRIRGMRDD